MRHVVMLVAVLVVTGAISWACIYASDTVDRDPIRGDASDDHELALSAARARERVAVAPRSSGVAVPAVLAPESRAARDATVGVDQARAEARERMRRYNAAMTNGSTKRGA